MRLAVTLVLALVAGLLVPGSLSARCRPSQGDRLEVLTPRVTSGTVLLVRRPVWEGSTLQSEVPARLRLTRDGCTEGCSATVALEQLATNLFALRLPRTMARGRWRVASQGARGDFELRGRTVTAAIAVAPAGPTVEARVAGTRYFVPGIDLATAAPADAVGLLARWPGSSYFMAMREDRRSSSFFSGRCTSPLPGYVAPTPGTEIELFFVDASGNLSPAARVTMTDVQG